MSSPNSILEGREVELQPLAPETNPDAGDTEEAPPPAADEAPISQRQPKSKGPLIIAWILSLLTLAFFVLTLLYALHSSAVSHIAAFGGAPSRPTRVLRVLSEIVSLLMVATLAGILQIIQHMCVVHMVGNWLIGYLTLDSGVGLFGLLGALFGRGTVWIPARLWSFGRIWFLLMIPALSVLVMSKNLSCGSSMNNYLLSFWFSFIVLAYLPQ
jgi:hypothetical protein